MAKRPSALRFQPAGGARSSALPVGKKQRLCIERLAHDGRGIAHEGGRTWFVAGALAGETIEARVLATRSQVIEARTERVLQASALRQSPACALAGQCGGCTLQHLPHAEQIALKQRGLAEQLARAGLTPQSWAPPLQGEALGYRRRARLAVRWDPRQQQLQVGFRAASSQSIVDLDSCPVLEQSLQKVLAGLPAVLRTFQRPRAIGHVELFSGSSLALLLRHTEPLLEADIQRLRAFCAAQAVQLWWQGEGHPEADVPGQWLGYRLEPWGLQLAWQPGDFVQVNAAINAQMVSQALEWLAPQADERVLDLFCGLGNFALPLAQRCAEVVGVEGVSAMVERAASNARANGLDNVQFLRADLSEPLQDAGWAQQGFAAVLLDPPREGAAQLMAHLPALGAQRVLYVSCNPATLVRDAASLVARGYRLERVGLLDMFPQTAHAEAMALFVRTIER